MAISTRQVKNKRDSNGVLTGRPGTVYDVNIKYTAPNGEKKTYSKKGFPTKKEATQHEAEMKAKLHNPGQIASIASQRKQTVASYLNEWVESYARVNLRPSTYDGYKKTIANYINPYIGGVALNQLTPAISASWVSSQFGKLLEDLDMPHIRFHDLRHTAATNMHQLTGDFYTVGEVLGHTLAGIGVSLGLSMNFEAVTARYVDVRLERKKEVLDAYHGTVKQADPAKAEKAEPKKAKKKSSDLEL